MSFPIEYLKDDVTSHSTTNAEALGWHFCPKRSYVNYTQVFCNGQCYKCRSYCTAIYEGQK